MQNDLRRKILIIDDDAFMRRLLTAHLSKEYDTAIATAGQEGLDKAVEWLPDLIILDIEMPDMDGWAVCQELKNNTATADIPVIMVSATTRDKVAERSFGTGAVDFVSKPIIAGELKLRIRNFILLKEHIDQVNSWKQKMLDELSLAGKLQRSLLSTKPVYTDYFDIYTEYRPSTDVGGDVFDVVRCSGGRTCIYIADVSGHGVASAILASMVKAYMLELLQANEKASPANICNKLEARFRCNISNMELYLTMFLMVHDPGADCLRCISCGHHPPIIYENGQRLILSELDESGGMPIALSFVPGTEYAEDDETIIPIRSGMKILCFTDGVVEAHHRESGEECGIDDALKILEKLMPSCPSWKVADSLLNAIEQEGFDTGADDCSIALIEVINPQVVKFKKSIVSELGGLDILMKEIRECLIAEGWSAENARTVEVLIYEYAANVIRQNGDDAANKIKIVIRVYDEYCVVLINYRGLEWTFEEALRYAYEFQSGSTIREFNMSVDVITQVAEHIDLFRYGGRHWGVFQIRKYTRLPGFYESDSSVPSATD